MLKNKLRNLFDVLLFILPAIILLMTFVVIPAVRTLSLSVLNADGEFVGFQNFAEVLSGKDILNLDRFPFDSPPWGAIPNNTVWILIHLPLVVSLGMILAVLLKDVWGASFIKSVIFLGVVTPMVVGGNIIRFLFDDNAGIVNAALKAVGLTEYVKTWTSYPDTALLALILGSVLLWTGFSLILYSSGLSTIPNELYEAAEVDGANALQRFYFITVPMLKPVTVTVVSMTLLWELKIFDLVYTATGGGPGGASTVLALRMYSLAFKALDSNKSAVIAVLLTVLTLIIGIWLSRANREKKD
ncbi:MAG: sugar ABC transporter permease [Anaerolineaceae bacterium]|nr:sugar ABC transporter permease [Anaerolineaceae bacterium]